jgi:hypothetical protein
MWNRACPLCFVRVPRSLVLTRSEDLKCPSCHAPLELSRATRVFSAAVGLLLAYVIANAVNGSNARGGWLWPIFAAVVGYGLGSASVLYFLADLTVRPDATASHFPQQRK